MRWIPRVADPDDPDETDEITSESTAVESDPQCKTRTEGQQEEERSQLLNTLGFQVTLVIMGSSVLKVNRAEDIHVKILARRMQGRC